VFDNSLELYYIVSMLTTEENIMAAEIVGLNNDWTKKVQSLANQAMVYAPANDCESMRISFTCDEEHYFMAIGEESGEEYQISYDSVSPLDLFYKLVPITD
jgi:hypothetical protein